MLFPNDTFTEEQNQSRIRSTEDVHVGCLIVQPLTTRTLVCSLAGWLDRLEKFTSQSHRFRLNYFAYLFQFYDYFINNTHCIPDKLATTHRILISKRKQSVQDLLSSAETGREINEWLMCVYEDLRSRIVVLKLLSEFKFFFLSFLLLQHDSS